MIYKEGKQVSGIHWKGRIVSVVRKGTVVVWEAIKSCFGKGMWIGNKPWIGTDRWKY